MDYKGWTVKWVPGDAGINGHALVYRIHRTRQEIESFTADTFDEALKEIDKLEEQ